MGKILKINEKTIKLNIWDTAGQERYMSFSKLYCRDAGAAVLVYDISEKESFEGMKKWYDGMSKDILPKETLLFIVGNKCDLVNGPCEFESDVLEYAEEICAEHFRVSAVSGLGIDELFDKIATKYAATVSYERRTSIILTNKFPLVANNKKKKRFC
jgi:small GTP-binding protein